MIPTYSCVRAIEKSGLQTEFLERTPERRASGEPSTKDGIDLFGSVPRSSWLTSRSTQRHRFSSNRE
jgi:hypothetical protein